ncbi:hypothetical protein BU17DRAFT_52864, partial [Hysterangium stoloniferum]
DCDTVLRNNPTQVAPGDCNVPCPHDSSEICGGSTRLSLFIKNHGPVVVQQFSGTLQGVWNLVGSFEYSLPRRDISSSLT